MLRSISRPDAGRSPSIMTLAALALLGFALVACSDGGGGSSGGGSGGGSGSGGGGGGGVPTGAFATAETTSRFLHQATFGPTAQQIDDLEGTSAETWFVNQLNAPATTHLTYVLGRLAEPDAYGPDGLPTFEYTRLPSESFWRNALLADDQLRQRMAFALSQIIVVSNANDLLTFLPQTVAQFQDILTANAFGNYRDILEEVTYSPAMGVYLTYIQNQKGDPVSGRVPDENYAREIMQLFTIGLVQLELDGDPALGGGGAPVETYTNDDVTGLARVFTGLSLDGPEFFYNPGALPPSTFYSPMITFPAFHSDLEKTFLGTTIPAGTGPEESIDAALDTLFNHPNVGPFIGRQLIQRFVMGNPPGPYIERVATAFNSGTYRLPDGQNIGTGERGDLAATIAAVLFDEYARSAGLSALNEHGKIREPVIRFANWARAFEAETVTPQFSFGLYISGAPSALAQQPYGAPSVFNFYRPGYVAPGTETGDAGLTIPELQLVNASTVAGYANFMSYYILGRAAIDFAGDPDAETSFIPDYAEELALANDPAALVDHLDLVLAFGELTDETKANIVDVVSGLPETSPDFDAPAFRVQTAVFMVMTAPDFLVQR
ncbi:MAG: DUF1800 domain-containing protein [Pseudomonadota bacterium]